MWFPVHVSLSFPFTMREKRRESRMLTLHRQNFNESIAETRISVCTLTAKWPKQILSRMLTLHRQNFNESIAETRISVCTLTAKWSKQISSVWHIKISAGKTDLIQYCVETMMFKCTTSFRMIQRNIIQFNKYNRISCMRLWLLTSINTFNLRSVQILHLSCMVIIRDVHPFSWRTNAARCYCYGHVLSRGDSDRGLLQSII
jgi:hypothetical protein